MSEPERDRAAARPSPPTMNGGIWFSAIMFVRAMCFQTGDHWSPLRVNILMRTSLRGGFLFTASGVGYCAGTFCVDIRVSLCAVQEHKDHQRSKCDQRIRIVYDNKTKRVRTELFALFLYNGNHTIAWFSFYKQPPVLILVRAVLCITA